MRPGRRAGVPDRAVFCRHVGAAAHSPCDERGKCARPAAAIQPGQPARRGMQLLWPEIGAKRRAQPERCEELPKPPALDAFTLELRGSWTRKCRGREEPSSEILHPSLS